MPRHKEDLQQRQKNKRPVQLNDGDEMLINDDTPERTNVDQSRQGPDRGVAGIQWKESKCVRLDESD